MSAPKIVAQDQRLKARKKLLAKEKAFTRARDALSAERRELPWVAVTKDCVFETVTGRWIRHFPMPLAPPTLRQGPWRRQFSPVIEKPGRTAYNGGEFSPLSIIPGRTGHRHAMIEITLAAQTMFAELVQRTLDAEFDDRYDERGRFKRRRKKGFLYWHYVRNVGGTEREEYVGPVRDAAINDRVKRFEAIKSDFKGRRQLVRALAAAGVPVPDSMTGGVVEALWKAGFFRLRGVLIGTAAFQCYSGILGARLAGPTLMTQDVDVAQFYDISHMVGDSMPPILEVLRGVDKTFRAVPDLFDRHRATRFKTQSGYLVEFLTPNRGSDDHQGKPADMPALGGASATPLRYLDYLIHEPVRSVLLYKGGIPVTVPAPAHFAIHKLIVATLRNENAAKSMKDIYQAEQLIELLLARRSYELFEAWQEAWDRGPTWRDKLKRGVRMMSKTAENDFLRSLETHGWSARAAGSKLTKFKKAKQTRKESA